MTAIGAAINACCGGADLVTDRLQGMVIFRCRRGFIQYNLTIDRDRRRFTAVTPRGCSAVPLALKHDRRIPEGRTS